MLREKRRFQFLQALFHCFDQQQLLGITFDLPLPAIHGVDLRNDVDARGQPHFYQLCRERSRIEGRTNGRQHDDRRHRPAILSAAWWATSRAAARYCPYSTKGSMMAAQTERPPTPIAVGTMAVLFFCRSYRSMTSSVLPSYRRSSAATRATTIATSTAIGPAPVPIPPISRFAA